MAVRRKVPPALFGLPVLPVGLAVWRKVPPALFGLPVLPVLPVGLAVLPVAQAVAVLAQAVPVLPLTQLLAVAVLGFGFRRNS